MTEKAGDQAQDGAVQTEPVYELRIYHSYENKLAALEARFRDHTRRLFKKHHIKDLIYWTPTDAPLKGKTLIYLVEHPSREAAKTNWQNMAADPEWLAIVAETEANGRLYESIDSTYMSRAEFSPRLF